MADTPPTLLPRCAVRVQIKPTWGGEWRTGIDIDNDGEADTPMYLECLTLSGAAAPTLPEASFKWDAGTIKREDSYVFADYPLLDIKDWYVQVLLDVLDDAGSVTETHRMFVGVVPSEDVQIGGNGYGDQNIHAVGVEYLLDRAPVIGSYTPDTDDPTLAAFLDTDIIFNEKWALGYSKVGNRSNAKIQADNEDGDSPSAYVFSDDAAPWTAGDIIEYLLAFHYDGDVDFEIGGQTAALNYVPPKYDPTGKTIHDIIEELVDRRRGLGWCVRYSATISGSEPATATLHIFTNFAADVVSGDTTIPANAEQSDIDLGETDQTIESVLVNADTLSRFGKVIVEGEPILSMFTLSFADSTLIKGWTDAEETAYKAGAGSDSDSTKNDAVRGTDKFRNVYQAFYHPDDWDWKAGDGAGGTKYIVNPKLNDDGTIDESGPDVVQGQFRLWGCQLANQLPLKNVDTDTEFDSEYASPFAMVKLDTDKWAMAHKLKKYPAGLRMLDNRIGIEVNPDPNHALAKGHWTGAKSSADQPQYAYTDILATVAVRTDQKLRVIKAIPYVPTEGEGEDQVTAKTRAMAGRVKRIYVEGAELWYIVKGTVTGLKDDGTLDKNADGLTDRTLRDDGKHVRLVAELAAAWYGAVRSAVTVQWARPVFDITVGNYLTGVYDAWVGEPINTVVTRKTFDCRTLSTTIETAYAELDAAIAGGPLGKPILPDKVRVRGARFGT